MPQGVCKCDVDILSLSLSLSLSYNYLYILVAAVRGAQSSTLSVKVVEMQLKQRAKPLAKPLASIPEVGHADDFLHSSIYLVDLL